MSLDSIKPKNFYDTDGEQTESSVSDNDARNLLVNILKQLKIMNTHLALLTNHEITKKDVE